MKQSYKIFEKTLAVPSIIYSMHIILLQLHTSEIQDGSDWNRLNLQSITEQNTLEDFLETAELAGVEFTAG